MRFDLTDLRVFLHACEGGSMTEAAARSHLTLQAVSARIRALEDEAGQPLLRRHARGVVATGAGEALARHARLVFHQVGQLERDLAAAGESTPPAGGLVVLANSSALARPWTRTVADVLRAHPDARLAIRESESEATVRALQQGSADLGIASDAVAAGTLEAETLVDDPLAAVLPLGHALAMEQQRDVAFRDLLAHPWIGWSSGSALQAHLALHAFRAGMPIRHRLVLPSVAAVLQLVQGGAGVGVLPAALVPEGTPVALMPLADSWARRRLLLLRRAGAEPGVAESLGRALRAEWGATRPRG